MALSASNFQKLLEPGLRKLFFEAYDELPEQYSSVFNVEKSKKAKETDYRVSGTGLWDIKEPGGPISEEGIEAGLEVSYTHTAYAKMISVERELVDDEQYNTINRLPKQLGRGCRATVEMKAADVFNKAFSTNGYDGVPMLSASHPLLKGGTCSNTVGAVNLDSTNLQAAIVLMSKTVTEEGLKMQAKPDQLIVPTDLEFQAMVLLQTAGIPGSPNNDINVVKGKLKLEVIDYLTDSNAWFIRDKQLAQNMFFWRVKPEFKSTEIFDNMVAKYRGYARFSCGYSDWRGIVGGSGTN